MTPMQHIKSFRADCARVKSGAEDHSRGRWHIVGRGVEIVALDENGERDDSLGGPEYISAKELTVARLKQTAEHWRDRYSPSKWGHTLSAIHLAGGFDIYDSFADYMAAMRGDWMDHDVWDDWAGEDIPLSHLLTD